MQSNLRSYISLSLCLSLSVCLSLCVCVFLYTYECICVYILHYSPYQKYWDLIKFKISFIRHIYYLLSVASLCRHVKTDTIFSLCLYLWFQYLLWWEEFGRCPRSGVRLLWSACFPARSVDTVTHCKISPDSLCVLSWIKSREWFSVECEKDFSSRSDLNYIALSWETIMFRYWDVERDCTIIKNA